MAHVALLSIVTLFINAITSVPLQYFAFSDRYEPYEMNGWTNFNSETNLTTINIGHSLGVDFLYAVTWTFFEFMNETCNTSYGAVIHPVTLKANYTASWNAMIPLFDELIYVNKSVFGFFLGDELVWNGLDPAQLDIAAHLIRNTYNDSIIFTNAAAPAIQYGISSCGVQYNYSSISPALTWFSVDIYHNNGSDPLFVSGVKSFYEQYVYPKMNLSYQYALVIPGSFASTNNKQCNFSCYDEYCAQDAINFYNWGLNDDRMIGMVPWHWLDTAHALGTIHMNVTKTTWINIGTQIVSSNISSFTH